MQSWWFRGELDIESLVHMEDDEVIKQLSSIKGIGEWTAEMLMLFSMQRPNIFSYGDLAILRGLRMLHHHRKITKKLFEKYRRRYSPYCSVASLYLWAIAVGKIPDMKDYAPKEEVSQSAAFYKLSYIEHRTIPAKYSREQGGK